MPTLREQKKAMLDLVCAAVAYAETNRSDLQLAKIAQIITRLSMVDICAPLAFPQISPPQCYSIRPLQEQSLMAIEDVFKIAANN